MTAQLAGSSLQQSTRYVSTVNFKFQVTMEGSFHPRGVQGLGFGNPTSLAGPAQVACSGTITDVSVPPIPAHAVVFARVAKARFCCFPGAGGLHSRGALHFGHLPDVFALAVDEQVPDAAHVAIVEQSSPHLGGEDEAGFIFWEAPQVQLVIQVQNLTLPGSSVGGAQGVDGNGTCGRQETHTSLQHAPCSTHDPFPLSWNSWRAQVYIFLPIPSVFVLLSEINRNTWN